MTLKVVKRWTTRDGRWDYNPDLEFGVPADIAEQYHHGRDIPGAGATPCIFVYAPAHSTVLFNTFQGDLDPIIKRTGDKAEWVLITMAKESGYTAASASHGPWYVEVNGVRVVEEKDGIGMPKGYHVSTFLVVDDIEESGPIDAGPMQPSAPDANYVKLVMYTYRNGQVFRTDILWQSNL